MARRLLKDFLYKSHHELAASYSKGFSTLAAVFNNRPLQNINLSLTQPDSGLFDVPELRTYEGFYLLRERCVAQTDELVAEAISLKRSRKMVEIFDELSDILCKVADLAEFIRIAHPSAKYSQAAEISCATVSGIVEKLNTNRELFQALKEVVEHGDKFPVTETDKHVAKLFLFDFEQSGIHLHEAERQKVVQLNDRILHLGQRFVARALSPRTISRLALPESARQTFSTEGDNIQVSGLYADSSDPLVRECAYRIFLHPDEQQEYLLTELLSCRNQLARVCGFETYSERALRGSTVETPAVVSQFLNTLSSELEPRAAEDFKIMSAFKEQERAGSGPLAVWDTAYFSRRIKSSKFRIEAKEFSPYFSLGACMEGLNLLMTRLYGIHFEHVKMRTGETWAPDVYKLAVVHETEGTLGYIYCDFYERELKPNQDCHFTIQGGKALPEGAYQLPLVVLMLNLPMPRWSSPSLLTPGMVDNLFHEMGHAMHSMLARTKYQHVTGTRCSTDFAEVPSVLMEYFASDPRVIRTFAKHFQTQESIPDDMLNRLCASKHTFAASEMQTQVFYSMLDQVYHGRHPLNGSTTDVLAEMQNKYYGLPYVENTAWQLRFSHLVGYGAKYYSYLVSKAVASWIWQTYFESDPLSRESGELYRRQCLAHGGGKPPRRLVEDFLQRQLTPEQLVNSLTTEIDEKNSNNVTKC